MAFFGDRVTSSVIRRLTLFDQLVATAVDVTLLHFATKTASRARRTGATLAASCVAVLVATALTILCTRVAVLTGITRAIPTTRLTRTIFTLLATTTGLDGGVSQTVCIALLDTVSATSTVSWFTDTRFALTTAAVLVTRAFTILWTR